jgi:hypothetical protein
MLFLKSRKRKADAQKFLAQMANQWTLGRVRVLEERRSEQRATLNVGVWIVPMNESAPEIMQAFVALTRDISSSGLSIITNRSIPTPEFLVGFSSEPEAKFLRTSVLDSKDLGLGWLQLCIEVIGMVDKEDYPQLTEFAGSVMF